MQEAEIKELDYPCYVDAHEIDITSGCDVGCIYCFLSLSDEEPKLLDIGSVLDAPAPPNGFYVSPNSDCFSPIAAESTHKILERFLPEGVLFTLITKLEIPDETIELISKYPRQVIPTVSLARLDQKLNNYIEPGAATAEDRLATIKKMSDAGMRVKARLNPLYPGLDDTDEKLEETINAFADAGAHCVKTSYVIVRDSEIPQLRMIIEKMTDHPELKKSWEAMTETIKIHRGKGNVPPYEKRVQFYQKVNELCRSYGLDFAVCSVLDFPIQEAMPKGTPLCKKISTFYGEHIDFKS